MPPLLLIPSDAPSRAVVRSAYERFFVDKEQTFSVLYDPTIVSYAQTTSPQMTFVSANQGDQWLKFKSLVSQWRQERGAMSAITQSVLCPAYQAIIGMGPTAVPFLLAQLQFEGNDPDQWFWALRAITGADPIADQDRGDFVAMAKSWFDWAAREGYAW